MISNFRSEKWNVISPTCGVLSTSTKDSHFGRFESQKGRTSVDAMGTEQTFATYDYAQRRLFRINRLLNWTS